MKEVQRLKLWKHLANFAAVVALKTKMLTDWANEQLISIHRNSHSKLMPEYPVYLCPLCPFFLPSVRPSVHASFSAYVIWSVGIGKDCAISWMCVLVLWGPVNDFVCRSVYVWCHSSQCSSFDYTEKIYDVKFTLWYGKVWVLFGRTFVMPLNINNINIRVRELPKTFHCREKGKFQTNLISPELFL